MKHSLIGSERLENKILVNLTLGTGDVGIFYILQKHKLKK